ncbi:protein N-terminal and lysine N-methyltransferase EFM7 [Parastagonospora nodorum]|nr:protein N-terminal and lysine N-methyltransferase EFM7 [Parastagonospora nodorum]KAH5255884.1 protein N-terminal and lysine N-methyltransferase EFM7 [Parastagonospora nodorum]KAH5346912.1 protein N-terminal and lysine N-methyltransferase EFM7 [Parastagonospora nodorum]KAH5517154.1 protein N-terminal and lysine N-methyltransferase EFM7 [Parastagonospora nodorum]KAH5770919.1 protein N-terminal and lysine N-methyltransferase EFM7 [Parastagonospora nodorum]
MSSEVEEESIDLFQEPADFYEPEKQASFASHQLLSGQELTVRLVGHNPLWGHHLWNAGRTTSTYLEQHAATLVEGKTVLELGAGAGLPSLVCALNGAWRVVVTDYPDAELIDNLWYNINHCELLPTPPSIVAQGYLWGAPIQDVIQHLPNIDETFDVLILADLLFNHSEHAKLVKTVQLTLKKSPDAKAYVFFTPYRPWLLQKDLAFFDLAREAGFAVEKTFEKVMEKVMFEEDPGDELLRRTVYGYELTWAT